MKRGAPADGMIAARSPIGTSAHPAGSSLVQYNKRSFTHALLDNSRVRSIIAIKHETHITPVLNRNFSLMHFENAQASL
jgi:hypothetical protein